MAREERDQQRRTFGVGATDESRAKRPTDGPGSKARPLQDGAHRRLSRGQIFGLAALAIALLLLAILQPRPGFEGLHLLFFVGFMGHSTIKLVAAFTPRVSTDTPSLADEALPVYTIIVPLYREA